MAGRDKAANQLPDQKAELEKDTSPATTAHGVPLIEKDATMTVGPKGGPILLQDVAFIEEMAHFDRERIPRACGTCQRRWCLWLFRSDARYYQVHAAKVFEKIGKRTPIAIRFSTVGGESGSADTVRDPRGFAMKFYTEDGIWDLVGNNTPIFFIRDPILFPSFIHTQKRNPATHLKDANMFWDFITLRPETTHQVMFLFSDRGIPDGFRHMNGYGSHTFKLVNECGKAVYCKFHFKTDQKIKNIFAKRADELAGTVPDYSIKDLYNAIANGNYPSWTTYIQVMTFEQAEKSPFDPFDVTKVWPHKDYPLIQVGKLVLDRNPANYFAEVEQIAFSPAHMIPGIEPSPDRMLLGRIFSYGDTHRHRLGANYLQLPVNCPYKVRSYLRDGPQAINNQGGAPNYHPNSFGGPTNDPRAKVLSPPFHVSGEAKRYDVGKEDNFSQATVFYQRTLNEEERQRLVSNIVGSLTNAADFIQKRAVENFSKVDASLGKRIAEGLRTQIRPQANL
uniref:Catalase n=1 Tax=Protaetia brevitarsis TaxID=348688 RepID=A7LP30_PROBE|nr:catalase [Protaetia brevitarsis]